MRAWLSSSLDDAGELSGRRGHLDARFLHALDQYQQFLHKPVDFGCNQPDFVLAVIQAFGQVALAGCQFMQLIAHVAERMRHGARNRPCR